MARAGGAGLGEDGMGGVGEDSWSATRSDGSFSAEQVADSGGGNDGAGPQGIDGYTPTFELFGHAEDTHAHPIFRHCVSDVRRKPTRFHIERRCHVEDVWVLGFAEVREAGLRAREGTARVYLMHQVEALHRRVGCIGEEDGACVVDQDVDPTEGGNGLLYSSGNLVFIANVNDQRQRLPASGFDFLCGCVDRTWQLGVGDGRLRSNNDVGSVLRSAERKCFTDSSAGSRDKERFSL